MKRDPTKEPRKGDRWDDNYFGDGINCMTHEINIVGTDKISYFRDSHEYDERVIKYSTFRYYCKWRWEFAYS